MRVDGSRQCRFNAMHVAAFQSTCKLFGEVAGAKVVHWQRKEEKTTSFKLRALLEAGLYRQEKIGGAQLLKKCTRAFLFSRSPASLPARLRDCGRSRDVKQVAACCFHPCELEKQRTFHNMILHSVMFCESCFFQEFFGSLYLPFWPTWTWTSLGPFVWGTGQDTVKMKHLVMC